MWSFDSETDPGYWVAVESPTDETLRDVAPSANGPVAVGNGGVAVGRGRERWGIVMENGPAAKGSTLYAVDSTADGERVWFAGANGALGYYDIVADERRNFSVPRGNSNTFYALTVSGERGSEKFLVADGSGHVLPGHMEQDETDWSWSTSVEGGNTIQALTHDDQGYGYAVTNANVYMTTAEEEWTKIGIDRSGSSFYDCTFDEGVFLTGGGNGIVYQADELTDHDDEVTWTPSDLGGYGIKSLDAGHGAQLACGAGGGISIRATDGEWEQARYNGTKTFHGVAVTTPMIAVGSNGLIVERRSRDELSAQQLAAFGEGPLTRDDTTATTAEWTTTSSSTDDGDSGNDEADPNDEDTDSDADSPDS